ncbi:hypothetical protein FQN60_009203 [Etheostoma spectabile]|uniref:Uncharacterized protein n=1 Tax=Etheostoma spectabile TaxID=54343 RepID=A0A5J5CEV5_9PERO|nr:hypothetical protein FQN60_009203 [Etheostoma spectabile]
MQEIHDHQKPWILELRMRLSRAEPTALKMVSCLSGVKSSGEKKCCCEIKKPRERTGGSNIQISQQMSHTCHPTHWWSGGTVDYVLKNSVKHFVRQNV